MTESAATDPVDAWLQNQAGLNPREIELGLQRVIRVWEALGAPRPARHTIVVAGTNGKGSCVAMLDAILRAAGYRVGCYTSPHLLRYVERVRIDGKPVDEASMLATLKLTAAARQGTPLTYFELGTLAALRLFEKADLDVALLEVGLGGRLDAVNIVSADATLVTSVDLDHQDWLGEDREAIGLEKAGVFRPGVPAVCGDSAPPASLVAHAAELATPLQVQDRDFSARVEGDQWHWRGRGRKRASLPFPALRGAHQINNAAAVLAVLAELDDRLPVDQRAVRDGLLSVRLPGRHQVQRWGESTWVLDVAHNPGAAVALAANLGEQFVAGKTVAILGMLRDKDVSGVVAALRKRVDVWHLAGLDDVRGLTGAELQDRLNASGLGVTTTVHTDVHDAIRCVAEEVGVDDRVLVLGSFLTVGAVMNWMNAHRPAALHAV